MTHSRIEEHTDAGATIGDSAVEYASEQENQGPAAECTSEQGNPDVRSDTQAPAQLSARRRQARSRTRSHGPLYTRSRSRTVTICAALAAVALVLSYLESLIPLPVPVPGIKLGFANIAVIVALYVIGGRGAFTVNLLRILMAGLMFTGVFAMFYALSGGILSVLAMFLLKRAGVFSVVGVSVGGSVVHITGQICLASLIIQNGAIFMSLPILLISAIGGGVVVGLIAYLLLRALPYKAFK